MDYSIALFFTRPEIILSLVGMVLTLMAAWMGKSSARLCAIITVAALVGAGAYVLEFLTNPAYELGADVFGGTFRMDAFANFTKLLIYIAAIACVIVAGKFFNAKDEYRPEYPLLILFSAIGMSIMVSAVDLMTLYLGVELTSLSSYVLASFARSDDRSAEAGLKYFVLGALASGILLFGMSLTYGFAGTTSYLGIRAAFADGLSTGALFGVVFILAGLAFKIAAVPFHMWTPDVYEGAPTPVTTFFASAPKVAAVAVLMRMALEGFGGQLEAWRQIFIFAALASIVVGALGAIGQANLKRLLAYSSINNVGFILIGLVAGTVAGASAMLVYLVIYVAMTLGSFVALLMLRNDAGEQLEGVSDISGLSRTQPVLAFCLASMMFSLAGIPPLFGFWGKFVVFQAAVQADLIVLAAIGIAASVIGAFYYIKIVKVMYFDEAAGVATAKSDTAHWAILGFTTVFVLPFGYLLTPWLGEWAERAASALFLTI
ncbi:NADH-quinone oxidoreductase subunit NuoN [Altererythrobacter sp. MF3-039]|uniref:NADH-quinone oxidoreductase subunit NuoN n=1 Tax=Altererythrobacter sp. MF3-039 TaxID=3252901 RepID=UPI00390CA36A